jgi:esterase/lipase superfamily enzyme
MIRVATLLAFSVIVLAGAYLYFAGDLTMVAGKKTATEVEWRKADEEAKTKRAEETRKQQEESARSRAKSAAEAKQRAAEAKPAEEAKRAAEAKPAEEAKRAAEAKPAEEAKRAAEAKAAKMADPLFTAVAVYFGTDRKEEGPPDRPTFGYVRAQKLTVGRVTVTIPLRVHKVGSIPRPWEEQWLGIDVGRGSDPSQYFTIYSVASLTPIEFLQELRQQLSRRESEGDPRRQAFVFVHGYNMSFENAAYRAAQIAYDLDFAGVPFFYSWPSGGRAADYIYDEDSARLSDVYLREFLDRILAQSGAERVHLIAHSMGNVPLLKALAKLAQDPARPQNLGQIILAAPDVDWREFHGIAASIFATKLVTKDFATLYASSADRALQKAAEVRKGALRAGHIPKTGPLVVGGVHTIDVTATSMDIFSFNHSGYAESREIINDVIGIFKGLAPPRARTPILREKATKAGIYWQYPR